MGRLILATTVETHLNTLRFHVLQLHHNVLERLQKRIPDEMKIYLVR